MSLEQKISEEMKIAMKGGLKLRLQALRSLRAAILEFAKSGIGRDMTEEDEIKLLNNQAKRRRDAIDMFRQGGRDELALVEEAELEIIKEFLPKQMTDDEVRELIKSTIDQVGAKGPQDMGKVIGSVMKTVAGKADGKKVQELVKEMLA